MYLQVNEIQQAGTTGFKDVRGDGNGCPRRSWNAAVAPRAEGVRAAAASPAVSRAVTALPR